MQQISLEQTATYLESATVEQSIDTGHAIIHVGTSEAGHRFVLVNDAQGNTMLTESL